MTSKAAAGTAAPESARTAAPWVLPSPVAPAEQPTSSVAVEASAAGQQVPRGPTAVEPTAVEPTASPQAPPGAPSLAPPPAAAGPCGPLDPAPPDGVLWAALEAADRAGREALPRRVVMAELDGAPPAEAALLVEKIPEPDTFGESGESVLWVLTRRGANWVVVGKREWFVTEGEGGTFDGSPGVQVLRPEELRAACGQFLRVEQVDMRGSMDPRYFYRRFELLHVHDGALVVAFQCDTHEENVEGPYRAGTITERTVVYHRGNPLSIRVRRVRSEDVSGRRQVARTTYVLRGPRFEAPHDVCASDR